jgi:hypothetical protein
MDVSFSSQEIARLKFWLAQVKKGVVAPRVVQHFACPKCHWKCARRSSRKTRLDLLLALFFLRPFRCRSCRLRYYRLSL